MAARFADSLAGDVVAATAAQDPLECPWTEDDGLVPVSRVEWMAKNVFLVTVPSYRRTISCELTAVDVPRLVDKHFLSIVGAVVEQANQAVRCFLRQDLYSTFPMESYGDILFSQEREGDFPCPDGENGLTWRSLQEVLLSLGVGCVVRPSPIRARELFLAESLGAARKPCPHLVNGDALAPHDWLSQLAAREALMPEGRSFVRDGAVPYGHFTSLSAVVEDVIRGDVYVVRWTGAAAALSLPKLTILAGTTCFDKVTSKGYRALRWAQTQLVGRALRVVVHSVHPCDKDVANNTQLAIYDQLAHVRITAVLNPALGTTELGAAIADVGLFLLRSGLGRIRRPADAGVPRPTNFTMLCEAAADLVAAESDTHTALRSERNEVMATVLALRRGKSSSGQRHFSAEAEADTCMACLSQRWELPVSYVSALLRFNGDPWQQRFLMQRTIAANARRYAREVREDQNRFDTSDSASSARFLRTALAATLQNGMTRRCWHEYLWCGDFTKDPAEEPRTVHYRPLRTLMPMGAIADLRCCPLQGYMSGWAVLTVPSQDKGTASAKARQFLQMEVTLVNSSKMWRAYAKMAGISSSILQSITFSPEPGEETLYSSDIPLSVSVDLEDSDASAVCREMKISCQLFPLNEYLDLRRRQANKDFSPVFTRVDGDEYATLLSLPPTVVNRGGVFVYVVDVEAVISAREGTGADRRRTEDYTRRTDDEDDEDTSALGDFDPDEDEGEEPSADATVRRRVVYYLSGRERAKLVAAPGSGGTQPELAVVPSEVDLLADAVEELEQRVLSKDNVEATVPRQLPGPSPNDGVANGTVEREEGVRFACPIYFYFELGHALDKGDDDGQDEALRVIASNMYADVECAPVGIGTLSGVRGFVGDVVFQRTDKTLRVAKPRTTLTSCLGLLLAKGDGAARESRHPVDAKTSAVTTAAHDAAEDGSAVWPMGTTVKAAVVEFHDRLCARLIGLESETRRTLIESCVSEHHLLLCRAKGNLPTLRVPEKLTLSSLALALSSCGGARRSGSGSAAPPATDAAPVCSGGDEEAGEPAEGSRFAATPIRLSAGQTVIWRDARTLALSHLPRLSRSAFPPTAPLCLFAVFLRQLFAANVNKHRKIAKDLTESHGESHMDWAIMRLRFPSLPCLLGEDLERLPLSLRNAECAFCEDLLRRRISASCLDGCRSSSSSLTSPCGSPVNSARLPDPSRSPPPSSQSSSSYLSSSAGAAHALFAAEKPLAALLSLFFLLRDGGVSGGSQQDKEAVREDPASRTTSTVYRLLKERCEPLLPQLTEKPQVCDVVLYRVLTAGRATAAADGTDRDSVTEQLFLGSRDVQFLTDALDASSADPNDRRRTLAFPAVRQWLNRRTLGTMGFETLTEDDNEDPTPQGTASSPGSCPSRRDLHRTIVEKGLGPRPMQRSIPVLYHPLPWLSVLGSPLTRHEEMTPETLASQRGRGVQATDLAAAGAGDDASRRGEACTVTRVVDLRYISLSMGHKNQVYRLASYGRISRKDMETLMKTMEDHGDSLQSYLSLLLRPLPAQQAALPSAAAGGSPPGPASVPPRLADGQLTVFGTALDPLYVHYRTRQGLRFTLGSVYPTLAAMQLDADSSQKEQAVQEAELQLLGKLCAAARGAMHRIVAKLKEDARRKGGGARATVATRIFLRSSLRFLEDDTSKGLGGHIAIKVYPVERDSEFMEDEGEVLGEPTEAVRGATDPETNSSPAAAANPHQPFSLLGVVLRRLPRHELRVRYDAASDKFLFRWNDEYEEEEGDHSDRD